LLCQRTECFYCDIYIHMSTIMDINIIVNNTVLQLLTMAVTELISTPFRRRKICK
jgi:hypothetical protein